MHQNVTRKLISMLVVDQIGISSAGKEVYGEGRLRARCNARHRERAQQRVLASPGCQIRFPGSPGT